MSANKNGIPEESKDGLLQISSLTHLAEVKKNITNKGIALLFWADWHPPCHQLREMMREMVKVYKEMIFAWVSSKFNIYLFTSYLSLR